MKDRHLVAAAIVALLAAGFRPAAAEPEPDSMAPPAATEPAGDAAHKERDIKNPIKMHEPMDTLMAKPGMMKEDMHEGMMHKDAEMKDMMKKEEQDMK